MEKSFGAMLRQLPNKTEVPNLLVDISQTGLAAGLEEKLFQPAGRESSKDFYAELPISIRLTGDYHEMGRFASGIAALPRIVTLHDIEIAPAAKGGSRDLATGELVLNVTAKTYRYLDEDEQAPAKKQARRGMTHDAFPPSTDRQGHAGRAARLRARRAGRLRQRHGRAPGAGRGDQGAARHRHRAAARGQAVRDVHYAAVDERSPFVAGMAAAANAPNAMRPDQNRPREFLEQFSLDTLRMVGTVNLNGRLLRPGADRDGLVHRVLPGNHLGQADGRITAIEEGKISLIEIVPDGMGGFIERPAALALSE